MAGSEPGAGDHIVDRHEGLVLRTLLVSGLTLISRILGFVREVLSAALFGDVSGIYDAFVTAWRVPNLFRRLFGEGAIATSLQTAITEADGDAGNEAGRQLFLKTVGLTAGILLVFCGLAMAVAWNLPDNLPWTGWAWLGADPGAVRELVVRLLPFVVLICLAALCGGALQVRGHFASPNLAPAVMNLIWIAALVYVGYRFVWTVPAEADAAELEGRRMDMARLLAWGVLLAGSTQLLVQVPALLRHGLLRRARGEAGAPVGPASTSPRDVLRSALPLAIGAAVYQINVMVDGLMAEGLLADGGPSALYFANRVQQFPLALIAFAATSAVFPSLNALGHRGRLDELRGLHDRTQMGVLFLALPAAVGMFVLAHPIASVLFEHGAYGGAGVARITSALEMFALALLPVGAVGLASRTYFALGDFKTPVRVSLVVLPFNAGLNVLFVVGMGMDVGGLALATAISSWLNLLVLFSLYRRLGLPRGISGATARVGRVALAAAGSGVIAWAVHRLVGAALTSDDEAVAGSALALGAAALAGVGGYLGLAHGLAISEWDDVRARLTRRLGL